MFRGIRSLMLILEACGSVAASALEPAPFELELDEPVQVRIAGQPASLALVIGSVDQLILSESMQQRLPPLPSTKATLAIDGSRRVASRQGSAMPDIAGLRREQKLYWFPGQTSLPLDGTIGIMALPQPLIRLSTGRAEAPLALRMPLIGDADTTVYGLISLSSAQLAVTLNPSIKTTLPIIAAMPGADLPAILKGHFVGDIWQEEVMPGVFHSVRRLILDEPLQVGRLRFEALAARISATPARQGRPNAGKKPAMVLTLSRAQLEQQGCSSLVVDKLQMSLALHCTGPATISHGAIAVTENDSALVATDPGKTPEPMAAIQTSGSPFGPPLPPAPEPFIGADGWMELDLDLPVTATIAGKSVELAVNGGDLTGVLLNEVTARRLGLESRAQPVPITYGGRQIANASGTRETIVALGRTATTNILWLPNHDQELFGGSIEFSSIAYDRLRVRFGAQLPRAQSLRLKLSVPTGRSARAIAELPGIASFQLWVGLQKRWQLPLVSQSLAADLVSTLGGRLEGRSWLETLGYRLRRPVRRLVLARPLTIGPMAFKAVAVQIGGDPDASNRLARNQKALPDADVDPEEMIVRGKTATSRSTGRWLTLSQTQITEQRCTSMAIEKQAKYWELVCQFSH